MESGIFDKSYLSWCPIETMITVLIPTVVHGQVIDLIVEVTCATDAVIQSIETVVRLKLYGATMALP